MRRSGEERCVNLSTKKYGAGLTLDAYVDFLLLGGLGFLAVVAVFDLGEGVCRGGG